MILLLHGVVFMIPRIKKYLKNSWKSLLEEACDIGTLLQFEIRDLVIRIIFIAASIPIKFKKILYDGDYEALQTIIFEFSFK